MRGKTLGSYEEYRVIMDAGTNRLGEQGIVKKGWITKEADLPLEVVLLLIAGMAFLITGALLFPIANGNLSYYENGLYGLIMVIFALQITILGKTQFGDMGSGGRYYGLLR